MQNENHNNLQSWKSKLEELDSLPGEAMRDNKAAWEKLHARLEGRKPRKKILWHWMAAACILFLFMITLIIPDKKNDQPANIASVQDQQKTKQNQHEKQNTVAMANPKKDSVTSKHPVFSKKKVVVNSIKYNQLVHRTKEDKNVNLRIYDTVSVENPIAASVKKPLQAIDSSSVLVSTMPAKKRLPVVHNNELDNPVHISPLVARNSEKPSSHFLKLASQEVYKSYPMPVTKNFATINFKTSPN